MARIICISKYPPLGGGIASKTYWLTKALGERGHDIHIVTDRLGVDREYTIKNTNSEPAIPNVTVHRAVQDLPWIIPTSEQNAISLLNVALEVVETHHCEIIDASYLIPYGIVGYLTSQITGVPLVLRHGGSDIHKFLATDIWSKLFYKVFAGAKLIISDSDSKDVFEQWSTKIRILVPYVPDPKVFRAKKSEKKKRPVLALIGKANYHWQHKGWDRIIDIWSCLGDEFEYVIVCQGVGEKKFRHYVEQRLGNRVTWKSFVSPWRMPELLNTIDALFHFEQNLPFATFSNIALEALYCGLTVIVDHPGFLQRYRNHGLNVRNMENLVLEIPSKENSTATKIISNYMSRRSQGNLSLEDSDYKEYVISTEKYLVSRVY